MECEAGNGIPTNISHECDQGWRGIVGGAQQEEYYSRKGRCDGGGAGMEMVEAVVAP